MNELENFKKCAVLISSIKKLIGEDVFDESLKDKETEDIYDYIIEKTYELSLIHI